MSSQSLNASNFPINTGPPLTHDIQKDPYYYPPRDASDITRITKERIIYNAHKSGSAIGGNPLPIWIKGGNQYRLSYLFGKVECGGCSQSLIKTIWTSNQVLGS